MLMLMSTPGLHGLSYAYVYACAYVVRVNQALEMVDLWEGLRWKVEILKFLRPLYTGPPSLGSSSVFTGA